MKPVILLGFLLLTGTYGKNDLKIIVIEIDTVEQTKIKQVKLIWKIFI